jgi:hypothetical protein
MYNTATMRHCQRIAVNISPDSGKQLGAVLEVGEELMNPPQ